MIPAPRPSVGNPALTRPNWLKESPRDSKLLWLDKNENTDPQLLTLTRKLLSELDPLFLSTYPEMAAFYNKLGRCEDVAADTLLLTAGSDGVIRAVFEAFISPGDVVMHTAPTFAMYPIYCMIFGAKAVPIEYEASSQGPVLSAQAIMQALEKHRPRLFCLPNPDSPTGTIFTPDEMDAIIRKAGEVGAVALIDEAYHPFYPTTVAPLIKKYSHLIIARTFSKAWGLAGLRTGYAIACPELSQVLHKVRPMYEINTFAVGYLERMLDFKSEVLASVKRLNDGKAYFNRAMSELGFAVLNNQGNFTHVAFGAHQAKIFAALENLVLYRKDFKDRSLQGYSRFTSATEEVFKPVVNRIRETVKSGGPEVQ
jgi:histidinol-phosphate aminotransferase